MSIYPLSRFLDSCQQEIQRFLSVYGPACPAIGWASLALLNELSIYPGRLCGENNRIATKKMTQLFGAEQVYQLILLVFIQQKIDFSAYIDSLRHGSGDNI